MNNMKLSKFFEVPIYRKGILLVIGNLDFLFEVLKTKVSDTEARAAVDRVKMSNGYGTTSAIYDDWKYKFSLVWSQDGDVEGMIENALFLSEEIVAENFPERNNCYPYLMLRKTQSYVVAQCIDLLINHK